MTRNPSILSGQPFVTAWELISSIGTQLEASGSERVATLRLSDEVLCIPDEEAPSPFTGKTMGELRSSIVAGLGEAFAGAYKISTSAALLENILHHAAEPKPAVYDLRQTGLPRLSPSGLEELSRVLINASKFQERLVAALCANRLQNYPRHGGPNGIGFSVDDWTSEPSDSHTLTHMLFSAAQIIPLARREDVRLGELCDALSGEPIDVEESSKDPDVDDVDDFEDLAADNRGKDQHLSNPKDWPWPDWPEPLLKELLARKRRGESWVQLARSLKPPRTAVRVSSVVKRYEDKLRNDQITGGDTVISRMNKQLTKA